MGTVRMAVDQMTYHETRRRTDCDLASRLVGRGAVKGDFLKALTSWFVYDKKTYANCASGKPE